MTVFVRLILAVLLLAPFSACSAFGGDDAPEPADVVEPAVRPVEEIRGIEIGRTRDGIVVTAFGIAPTLGYADPRLEARRGGLIAEDGFLDFDFVATLPDPAAAVAGDPAARLLRADRLIAIEAARQARGLRIHGVSGGRAVVF
ncbi:MAG TPA: hypothetical protein VMM55_13445 [Thermohalobaculum sp.]|nr:hypothetical protein [Thermohalobaculum sp.]